MNNKISDLRKKEMPWGNNKGKSEIERLDPAIASPSYGVHMHVQRYQHASKFAFGRVLDLGCGVGYGSKILAMPEKVNEVIAIDISSSALNYAKKYYAHKKVKYLLSSAENLPFDDKYFDMVAAFEIIEHVTDYQKTLKEVFRVLKNNGYLFISSPNPRDLLNRLRHQILSKPFPTKYQENPLHTKEFYYEELFDIIRNNGFKIEDSYGQTIRLPILNYLLKSRHKCLYKIPVDLGKLFPNYSLVYVFRCRKIGEYK